MSQRISPLRQLADLISQSVDQIDNAFEKAGLDYPSLDAPFSPASPSEALSVSPDLLTATRTVVAACAQLGVTVSPPASAAFEIVAGFHVAAAVRVALESNTVEILRENPQGLDTKRISDINGVDPSKLARILRLLSTHHIFREVSPDVFCNNRVSSLMDTGKSVDAIKADPLTKHVEAPGASAIIEHSTDEVLKGAAFLSEVLLDRNLSPSEAPEDAPLMVATKYKGAIWEWYEESDNVHRFKRFSAAMAGVAKMDTPNAILLGFKWGDLPAGSVVVDVGGGMGHNTLRIARAHKHLKYVVQDRPATIELAKKYWEDNHPAAIADGSVVLQEHDFFAPQPVKNADVLWARAIVHDYGKTKATQILKYLRTAARPDTKLILIEGIVPYACLDDRVREMFRQIPGSKQAEAPQPLLANYGKAGGLSHVSDLQMLVALNGEERTLGGFVELLSGAGWKLVEVISIPGSISSHLVAIPI